MVQEKKFVDGMRFDTPRAKAPAWIKGHIAVNLAKFLPWAEANQDERGWLNVDVKESKKGTLYCELDTYRRTKSVDDGHRQQPEPVPPVASEEPDDLSF